MKKQKIFEKTVFAAMGLFIFILAGLSIFQQQQIRKLSRLAESESIDDGSAINSVPGANKKFQKNVAKGSSASDKNDIDILNRQLMETEKEIDAAHGQLSADTSRQKELKDKEKEQKADWRKNPLRRKTVLMGVEDEYGALFKELNLSSEKLDKLKELLVDRSIAFLDQDTDKFFSAKEEEHRELQQETYDINNTSDTKIRDLLGDDDLEMYKEYSERGAERTMVAAFNESLADPGDNLNEAQTEQLIDAMHEKRDDAYIKLTDDPYKIWFPSDLNEENTAKYMNFIEEEYSGFIQSGYSILSPSQAKQFETLLKQRQETEKMWFNDMIQEYKKRTGKK